MKHFKTIYMLIASLFILGACETYGDYDIDYTPIHPLGGQYRLTVWESADPSDIIFSDFCYIANTTDYDKDRCWIRLGNYNAGSSNEWAINGKISCNVSGLSFSGENIENLAGNVTSSSETFSVSNGKVELKAVTAPSGTVTDKITFTFTNSRFPGKTYVAEGYRFTGWNED